MTPLLSLIIALFISLVIWIIYIGTVSLFRLHRVAIYGMKGIQP